MDNRETNQKEQKAEGVRKPASFLDGGAFRIGWPFKLQDNRWYVARRTRQNTEGAACTEIKNS